MEQHQEPNTNNEPSEAELQQALVMWDELKGRTPLDRLPPNQRVIDEIEREIAAAAGHVADAAFAPSQEILRQIDREIAYAGGSITNALEKAPKLEIPVAPAPEIKPVDVERDLLMSEYRDASQAFAYINWLVIRWGIDHLGGFGEFLKELSAKRLAAETRLKEKGFSDGQLHALKMPQGISDEIPEHRMHEKPLSEMSRGELITERQQLERELQMANQRIGNEEVGLGVTLQQYNAHVTERIEQIDERLSEPDSPKA